MKKKIEVIEKVDLDGRHYIALHIDDRFVTAEHILSPHGYIYQDRESAIKRIDDFIKNLKEAKAVVLKTEEIEF